MPILYPSFVDCNKKLTEQTPPKNESKYKEFLSRKLIWSRLQNIIHFFRPDPIWSVEWLRMSYRQRNRCKIQTQSIQHPYPKLIKLQQAGWPLLSMCICCSGRHYVMTTPVVSGGHWSPNGFHMPLRYIQIVDTSCSHRGAAGIST